MDSTLIVQVIDMVRTLLIIGGLPVKEYFLECAGEDVIDNLQTSKYIKVRKAASNFADEFLHANLNDGTSSDLFFSSEYHSMPTTNTTPMKCDDERYYDDGQGEDSYEEDQRVAQEEGKKDVGKMQMEYFLI